MHGIGWAIKQLRNGDSVRRQKWEPNTRLILVTAACLMADEDSELAEWFPSG